MKPIITRLAKAMPMLFIVAIMITGCQKDLKTSSDKETPSAKNATASVSGSVVFENRWVFDNPADNITISFSYNLQNSGTDTSLTTSLLLEDHSNGASIDYGTLDLNDGNVRNKEVLGGTLASNYQSLANTYSARSLLKYTGQIEKMLTAVADTGSTEGLRSLVFQSLCMYNTLSKAPDRDIRQNGSVSFHVNDDYITGLSSFAVEEDTYIDIQGFKDYLNNLAATQQNEGIAYYLGALENVTDPKLNMLEITVKLQEYFTVHATLWPTGGQCGCCGNYSGPCYYWSKVCLAHDYACQSCSPSWFCFSGCKAGSCRGNVIAWYHWL
jgi:hypothetical protein